MTDKEGYPYNKSTAMMNLDALVKVCDSKSSEKIFLVQRSFSEKRLQEKILSIIKDFPNPYPEDIFTWDNPEKITDARGKYNKMFYTIVENTKDDIVKALVEEELEHHAKEVELTQELEEKINRVRDRTDEA
jgi:hypothetical protein